MRVASAPGRCGILGNPSDIYGGAVLSCSLPLRATCRLIPAEQEEPPEDPLLWRAARRFSPPTEPMRVEWETTIPRSSGLSGSTALLAATMLALAGELDDPLEFAFRVRRAEWEGAGITCGWQDATMIACGGLNLLDFSGFTPDAPGSAAGVVRPIEAELPFLLVTTGVERLSGSVHGPMLARWRAGESAVVEGMREIAGLAPLGAQTLVAGDYGTLAALMARNHAIVRGLGGSGAPIERLIKRCLHHGALAAKLAGAGLGGTVVALTDDAERLRRGLAEDGYTRFARPEIAPGARLEPA